MSLIAFRIVALAFAILIARVAMGYGSQSK